MSKSKLLDRRKRSQRGRGSGRIHGVSRSWSAAHDRQNVPVPGQAMHHHKAERSKWCVPDPCMRHRPLTPLRRREQLISAFMVNLRLAQLDNPEGAPSPVPKNKDPTMYLLPDRILHPRYESPKTGLGMWVTCHHSIIARLAGPGESRLGQV